MSRTGEMSRLPPLSWDQYGPCGLPLHMCADWEGRDDTSGKALRGLRRIHSIGEFIPLSINGVPTGDESYGSHRQPEEEIHSPTPRSSDDTQMSSTWGTESVATSSAVSSDCALSGLEDASTVMDNCSTSATSSMSLGVWGATNSMELSHAHHDFRDGNSATVGFSKVMTPFDEKCYDAVADGATDCKQSSLQSRCVSPAMTMQSDFGDEEVWLPQPREACDDVADDATSMGHFRFQGSCGASPESTKPELQYEYQASDACSSQERAGTEAGELTADETNTTRMVQNLPRHITRQQFLDTLNKEFGGLYNFCHMPKAFKSRLNMGYAFVNFVSEEVAATFANSWNRGYYPGVNRTNKKMLRVTDARVQGLGGNLGLTITKKMTRIRDAELRPLLL